MTATVTPSNATGWVTFNDGATPLGSVPVSAGQAAFKIRFLGSGFPFAASRVLRGWNKLPLVRFTIEDRESVGFECLCIRPEVKLSPGTASLAAQADFDADGKVDLAVYGGSQVTILLGQGTGSFRRVRHLQQRAGTCWPRISIGTAKIDLIAAIPVFGKGKWYI